MEGPQPSSTKNFALTLFFSAQKKCFMKKIELGKRAGRRIQLYARFLAAERKVGLVPTAFVVQEIWPESYIA